ncbi:MAG: Zinc-specific metallo-regulatory protein [Syntrophomonadaceae bacterium]|nr:Zinc-specific metallo-regulatory protein [Bacillota bacterium]
MKAPVLLSLLKEKGYKLTAQRQAILAALRHLGERASAKEIYTELRKEKSVISLDTVYRNLRLLAEIGIVQQILLQSGTVFELTDDSHHHHHLVCVDCEKVVCISYCPESCAYTEQAKLAGFDVLGHLFEVYGRCTDCQQR